MQTDATYIVLSRHMNSDGYVSSQNSGTAITNIEMQLLASRGSILIFVDAVKELW